MSDVTVNVVKVNGQYALHVKKGTQEADIEIPDCKNEEEANLVKDSLMKQIAAAEGKQAAKPQGVGEKLDKAA